MRNSYAKAIAVLDEESDFKRLVFEIAKVNPSAVVRAANRIADSYGPAWVQEGKQILSREGFVYAIRHIRDSQKCSLAEAKRIADGWREQS